MNNPFTINLRAARRVLYTMVAALLVVASLPLLETGQASAAQLQSRSIKLSDSAPSGTSITSGVGSGTNVSYLVTFTTGATSGTTHSLVIDFCSQDPIIDDTCTAPVGMSASGATLNATATAGTIQTTTDNWAVTAGASQVKLADDGVSGHGAQQNTTESFTLSGITNPSSAPCGSSTSCSFYARIYDYANNTWGTYSNAGSVGNFVDYGGIALSTANVITITARVQEQLEFCVSGADPSTWTTTHDCSDPQAATLPALTLGHGSPTLVLDASAVDTGDVFTQLSTNATHGAIVTLRNSNTTCTGPGGAGGLTADNGTTCAIPPVNGGTPGPTQITAGSAAFGMFCETESVSGIGTIGAVTPTPDYNDGTHIPSSPPTYYGMDTTSGTYGSVVGTYGSTIATTASPVYRANDEDIFAATASLTTPAGIYTANLDMIATGTF